MNSMIRKAYYYTVKFVAPFIQRKSRLSYDEAKALLNEKHADHEAVIKSHNSIDYRFDLHIVIPAYNVSSFVAQCLDSIFSQKTSFDFYVTVVNDGSTDKTLSVLEDYRKKHGINNLEIIDQKNGGIAAARNAGLKSVLGRYVMFVDSDDCLAEGAIECLMKKAVEMDADIVEGSSIMVFSDGHVEDDLIHSERPEGLRGQPWGKVIKASVFENLCFPEGYDYEDSIFAFCIYPFYKRQYTVPDVVYKYRVNENSITRSICKSYKVIDHFWLMEKLWEYDAERDAADQKLFLRTLALGGKRTRNLEESVSEAGFVFLSNLYLKHFPNPDSLSGIYAYYDKCVRTGNYGVFRYLSRYGLI